MHTMCHNWFMETFDWNDGKNAWLKAVRGVTFEEIVYHIQAGDLLDVVEHSERGKYPGQRIFIVDMEGYAFLVPFVESEDGSFLKTIIPSRKMTRRYLGSKDT